MSSFYTQGFGTRPEDVEIPHIDTRSPASTDVNFPLGKRWINTSNGSEYSLCAFSSSLGTTSASWSVLGGGSSDVNTLTGNTGGAISPTAGNINILGGDTVTVAGSGSTLTINAKASGYPITPYVVGPSGKAGYQTIQAALDAAHAAGSGVVYIQPGTYTENLTLYAGVALFGSSESETTIIGTHTPPSSGEVNIFRCKFQSPTAIFSSSAAGSATMLLEDTQLSVTNGFSFDLPNWTGVIEMFDMAASGTNDGFINNTGGASLFLFDASIGVGSGQTMLTSGTVLMQGCRISCPLNMRTGSSFTIDITQFYNPVTLSNNSTGSFTHCKFNSGGSAAITMSSSGSVSISNSSVSSSNDPCIAGSGAGTLTITDTSLLQNYNIASTLTVSSKNIRGGNFLSQYVVAKDGSAPYSVIQTALTAARDAFLATSIPQTVYVKPGVYTENLTFYNGVDLCAAGGQVDSKFTNVVGTHMLPASGTTATYGIWYTGTTACFSAPVAGTCKVNMFNVITEITGVGYTFDVDGFSGELNIFDYLQFDTGTNGFVNNPTGGAEVNIIFAGVGLAQNTSATAIISGNSFFQGMLVSINMHFVGTSSTQINMGCELQGTISTADSASVDIANTYCFVGTAKAINHLSSGTIYLSNVGINSSNGTPIDGTGSITLTNVGFLNSSDIAGTLTITGGPSTTGSVVANGDLKINKAAKQLQVHGGAVTDFIGRATLVNGTIDVANTNIAATDRIFVTRSAKNASTAYGTYTTTITASTKFNITSQKADTTTETNDASTLDYFIVRQT